jgi:hypothetical protein
MGWIHQPNYTIPPSQQANRSFNDVTFVFPSQSLRRDSEELKGKKHQVFKLSFDAKWIESRESLEKLLDYVHHNPVSGRWNLVDDFALYKHSSASFYELGQSGNRLITDYRDFH